MRRVIAAWGPDVIHQQQATWSLPAVRAARETGTPLVVTLHGGDAYPRLGRGVGAAWNARNRTAAFEGASRLLAVSRYLADVALGAGVRPAAAERALSGRGHTLVDARPERDRNARGTYRPVCGCAQPPQGRRRPGPSLVDSGGASPAPPGFRRRRATGTRTARARARARVVHGPTGSRGGARLDAPRPRPGPAHEADGRQAGSGRPRPARGAGVRRSRHRLFHGRHAGDDRAGGLDARRRTYPGCLARSIDEALAWSPDERADRGAACRDWVTRERSLRGATVQLRAIYDDLTR